MPELPEVETVRRDLAALLPGRAVTRVEVPDSRALRGFGPDGGARRKETPTAFAAAVVGRTAREVLRRGKYLAVLWDDGTALLSHLRMTGQWIFGPPRPNARVRIFFSARPSLYQPNDPSPVYGGGWPEGPGEGQRRGKPPLSPGSAGPSPENGRGDRWVSVEERPSPCFSPGETCLSFCDARRFGELWRSPDWTRDPAIAALGPEPLGEGWNVEAWGQGLRKTGARMQAALLDQRRLAGLGNIYVTEALFLSGIRPTRRGRDLRSEEIPRLAANIRKLLKQGVAKRGVSFRNYRDARGEPGRAREILQVYGKAGTPCSDCRTELRGVKVNGRGTVYCPRCQR